jgi:Poly(ADP-ribose) polymerase catalytic domain
MPPSLAAIVEKAINVSSEGLEIVAMKKIEYDDIDLKMEHMLAFHGTNKKNVNGIINYGGLRVAAPIANARNYGDGIYCTRVFDEAAAFAEIPVGGFGFIFGLLVPHMNNGQLDFIQGQRQFPTKATQQNSITLIFLIHRNFTSTQCFKD